MEYVKSLRKLATLTGWRQFFKVLNKKEKKLFFILLLLSASSFIFLFASLYVKNTEIAPAKGGSYAEGIVGSPRFINPVYAQASDVDRDLAELTYSGLMKYNEKGEIVPDLAEDYKILEEGRIFEFHLKENLLWSDNAPLTAEDVIFTVKSIQNPSLKSPVRASWLGVNAEKISELAVRFELKNPSMVFLENCTLKIMPKHIWENVSDQNFPLSIYNLKPIGSGPYKVKEITQDKENNIKSLELSANANYHERLPHIREITFLFFSNEDELISAFNSGKIDGFYLVSPAKKQNIKSNNFSEYAILLPRYFAVFLNQNSGTNKTMSDREIRQALNYGTNKQEIVDRILLGQGKTVDSPILPGIYGFENPSNVYEFNPEKAKQILDEVGFLEKEDGTREKIVEKESAFSFKSNLRVGSQGTEVQELQKCLARDTDVYPEGEITGYFGEKTEAAVINFQEKYKKEILEPHGLTAGNGRVLSATREKLNQLCASPLRETTPLSFVLTTLGSDNEDQSILVKTAYLLKEQWENLGIQIEIQIIKEEQVFLEEIIRTRNYEMILFGNALGSIPDPYPFWHSSQTKDPGLNLASFENKEIDKLLEKARQTLDKKDARQSLQEFQNILIEDAPAVFLFNPSCLYLISEDIKNVSGQVITDPSKRFTNIENWYIKTKRAFK